MIDGKDSERQSKTVWTYKGHELLVRNGDYKSYYLPAGSITRAELAALKSFIEDVELEEEAMREAMEQSDPDRKPTIAERIFGE